MANGEFTSDEIKTGVVYIEPLKPIIEIDWPAGVWDAAPFSKNIFQEELWKFFEKYINRGINCEIYPMMTIFHANGDKIVVQAFRKCSDFVRRSDGKIYLRRPDLHKICGSSIPRGTCRELVARHRGGKLLEKTGGYNTDNLYDFLYSRRANIFDWRLEMEVAQFYCCPDYVAYIKNFLIKNDFLFEYYSF